MTYCVIHTAVAACDHCSACAAANLQVCVQVQDSRLILIAISSGDRSDLERLGLHDHETLLFPAYSDSRIRKIIKYRLGKLDGVIDPEALKYLAKQVSYCCALPAWLTCPCRNVVLATSCYKPGRLACVHHVRCKRSQS